jgi:hypothetical protein
VVGKEGGLGVGRGRTGGRVGEGGRAGTGAEGVEWVLVQTTTSGACSYTD